MVVELVVLFGLEIEVGGGSAVICVTWPLSLVVELNSRSPLYHNKLDHLRMNHITQSATFDIKPFCILVSLQS
jgi:hypothetical protein